MTPRPALQTITTHLLARMSAARHGWNVERPAHTRRRSRPAGLVLRHGHTAVHAGTARIEYRFRHPEVIAVDPALAVDAGNHSYHNTPKKPDPPRHWDHRD